MLKRSLGRLVGGRRAFQSYNYYHTTTRHRCKLLYTYTRTNGCFYAFPTSFQRRSEYCKSKYEEETKGRSDSDSVVPTSSYTNMGKEVEDQSIKKGDIINLHDLLFTKDREYLVKNNGERVKAEQLEAKVIVMYFVPLVAASDNSTGRHTAWLIDAYNDLQPNNNFEVVFVAVNDDADSKGEISLHHSLQRHSQKYFADMFSCMPWPAVPLSDITSRKRLQRRFGASEIVNRTTMVFIDSMGMVLQRDPWYILDKYGALGYPFTDERVKFLEAEDEAAVKQPSLKALLACPQRDYLISNKGKKVPIQTLEDKVVAVYFYEDGLDGDLFTEKLKMAYERFAKVEQNFEIVLVYLSDTLNTFDCTNKETFWQTFKTMPWLALPFKDPGHKKLRRIFEYPYYEDPWLQPWLVIFGPHGEFIEPFGASILFQYKIEEAFPFTRKKAAKLEMEKVKELKLEMLWDPNTIFRREDGSRVAFSQLFGKRVILFFESLNDNSTAILNFEFLKKLKERYLQMQGTDDEFEVIHILKGKGSMYFKQLPSWMESSAEGKKVPSFNLHIGDIPWLLSLGTKLLPADFGPYHSCKLNVAFLSKLSSIFAFDRDGRLVRRTLYPTVEDMNFPFCAASDLEEETLTQLNTFFRWNYWDYYPKKGKIYSYNDKSVHIEL